jgi:uncharacterized protein YdaU (DUF1376 family)
MAKPIWFPFFVNDFLSSGKVTLMTTDEVGAYVFLLCHEWQDSTCSLPSDDVSLQKLGRFSGDVTRLRDCFVVKRGRLVNERLYSEWVKVQDNKALAVKAANMRWHPNNIASAMRPHIHRQSSSPSPSPSPSPKNQEPSESPSEKETKIPRDVQKRSREAKSSGAWNAYMNAYRDRYGVTPERNATNNSLLCQLVDKVGQDNAPLVAAFYITHQGSWYTTAGHAVTLLVRDAQKLLTEYKTGNVITNAQARQDDGRAARGQMWQRLIEKEQSKKKEGTV